MSVEAARRSSEPEGDQPDAGGRPWAVLAVMAMAVAVAVAAGALLRSRADRDEPSVPKPSTAAPAPDATTTPTTPPDASQAAADAYLDYLNAFERASEIPDPFWPALRATATGAELKEAFDQIQAWKVSGRVASYPGPASRHRRPVVVAVDGPTATLRHCEVDDGQVRIVSTGEVVNDQVVTLLLRVEMSVEDNRWKVTQTTLEQRWEGIAGCAAEGQ